MKWIAAGVLSALYVAGIASLVYLVSGYSEAAGMFGSGGIAIVRGAAVAFVGLCLGWCGIDATRGMIAAERMEWYEFTRIPLLLLYAGFFGSLTLEALVRSGAVG
jgi:hypothetical protein